MRRQGRGAPATSRGAILWRVAARFVAVTALMFASRATEARAQSAPRTPPTAMDDKTAEAQRTERAQLEQQLSALRARVEQLEASQAKTKQSSTQPGDKTRLSDNQSVLPERSTMQEDQSTAPRPGNAPVDPAWKGFGHVPGTSLWFKLGGYAKVDGMFDYPTSGNPNEFVTASIPVSANGALYAARQFNLHAKQSRVNVDLRSPTKIGAIRVFYENDFFGDPTDPNLAYRVRHLYVQLANVTVGHTWSVFTDPDTVADTLDFSGPGSRAGIRQPQVRYTYSPIKEHFHLALGVEQPRADLAQVPDTSSARNVAPDVAVNARWEWSRGHVQASGVGRLLALETDEAEMRRRAAWGAKLSGSIVPVGRDSIVIEATVGNGVGRYVQDLNDGYGAYVTDDGELRLIGFFGAYLSYKHYWVAHMTSSVTYGYAQVAPSEHLDPSAYHRTHYVQANFVWSPVSNLFIGAEQLWGRLVTQNGDFGSATRSQLSFKFAFSL